MKRQQGFTLIELLIVIAIIAILVAILVPVFFSVKESARQGTTMENLKLIGQGVAQYKLDNHRPPQVLFGYANGGTMDTFKPTATTAAYPAGLYPAYVKTADTFKDPDNTSDTTKTVTVGGNTYYSADAFDVNPQVTGTKALNTSASIVRYAPSWEPITSTPPTAATDPNYLRQLQFPNPPGDTYVTCTTFHVPNADKVLVLFENGSVKKMTGSDFAASEPSNFWTVKP